MLALDPVSVGLPATWAARRANKPLVVKIGGDYAWEQGQQRFGVTQNLDQFIQSTSVPFIVRILRRIQSYVVCHAVRIIAPSSYLKHVILTWGAIDENVTVIYNAVPLESPGTVPESVAALARPFAVTAGRLVPWKNIEGVIDAVTHIPEMSLVIVGDGPHRSVLVEHSRKLGTRVVFTGTLSHADLLATIKHADVFVLNSSYEGLSHLLVEASMLGVPIVATWAGGNAEIIEEGANGALVRVGDTAALTRALKERKPPTCTMGGKFNEAAMLTATVDLLKSL